MDKQVLADVVDAAEIRERLGGYLTPERKREAMLANAAGELVTWLDTWIYLAQNENAMARDLSLPDFPKFLAAGHLFLALVRRGTFAGEDQIANLWDNRWRALSVEAVSQLVGMICTDVGAA
jgi:hypothetical protein